VACQWFEKSYIQELQLQGSLIDKQDAGEINNLFALVQDLEAQHKSAQCSCPPNNTTKTLLQYIIP